MKRHPIATFGSVLAGFLAAALFLAVVTENTFYPGRGALAGGVGIDRQPMPIYIVSTGVVDSNALQTIGSTRLSGNRTMLSLEVLNADAAATLTNFKVQVRQYATGNWVDLYSSTDWADADVLGPDDWSGTDMDSNGHYVYQLTAGEYCTLRVYVGPVEAVRFLGQCDASYADVTIRGHAN